MATEVRHHAAGALFFVTMLYGLLGIPSVDRDTTLDTDYVSPVNRYIWLGLLLAALPLLRRNWQTVRRILLAGWPLLLLYGYFALSTLWALDPAVSLRRYILALVQLALLVILLAGTRHGRTLHLVVVAGCAIVGVADLLTWLVAPGFAMTDEGFAGLQTQKNQTGLLMMYGCLAGGTALFLARSWLTRFAVGGTAFLSLFLLVASRSTTSLFVVLIMPPLLLGVLGLARLSSRTRLAVLLVLLLTPALLLFLYVAGCAVAGSDPWLPLRGVTFTERTDIWSFTVDEIARRPWLGAGYGSFWAIDPAVQPSLQVTAWFSLYTIINEAHDGYLDLLATNGVIGLALGLFVLFGAIGKAFAALQRLRGEARVTALFHMSVLLGLLVHNALESDLFSNSGPLAIALLVCLIDVYKSQPAPLATPQRWTAPIASARLPPAP